MICGERLWPFFPNVFWILRRKILQLDSLPEMAADRNKMDSPWVFSTTPLSSSASKPVWPLIHLIWMKRKGNGISRVYLQLNLNTFERQISHEKNGLSKVTIIHSWPHWGLRGGRANGHIWSKDGHKGHILPIYGHRMERGVPRKRRKKTRASWVEREGNTCGQGSPEWKTHYHPVFYTSKI